MSARQFTFAMYAVAVAFASFFAAVVVPGLIDDPNVFEAFAAGFENPFAAGYSTDVILCWVALAIWVFHEAKTLGIQKGWIFVALGIVPGVAVGLPLYIVWRSRQLSGERSEEADH